MRVFVAVLAALVGVAVSEARIITVDDDGAADFSTIQAAIDDSNDGDTVLVADGTYTGDGNRDIEFHGKAITVKSENGPADCIIDCQSLGNGLRFHAGEGWDTILDGFTVTNAYDAGTGGRGIECDDYSSPTITRCIVTGTGSGIEVCKSSVRISNCVAANNNTGIACVVNGSATITNCTVVDNSQSGIYCKYDSIATVANCIVRGNGGGQISLYNGSAAIVTYSNIEGGWSGEGNIDGDPCFVTADYYRLLPGSVCIDAGTNSPEMGLPDIDIEGYARSTDGDDDGEDVADMGAYESWPGDAPVIWLSENEIEFAADEGGPNPPEQILTIHSSGDGTVNWVVSHNCPWLEADPNAGSSIGQGEVVLRADVSGLAEGEYSCVVTVSDVSGINRRRRVVVNLHVGLPLIGVEPTAVAFDYPVGGSRPEPQALSIWNDDTGVLDWVIAEDCNWLEVEPNAGSSTGLADEVTLSVDTSGLPAGMYQCALVITAERASNSPYTFPVTLHVGQVLLHVPGEYGTIQAAIDDSHDRDKVLVADGTYTGDGNRDIDFHGRAITVKSENGAGNCIIDCNGTEADPHRGFYFRSGEDPNSAIIGFTITNGYSPVECLTRPPFTCSQDGGGIRCVESSPTISQCRITGNWAHGGGGISCLRCSPIITECTFTGNDAGAGGGMGIWGSNPIISNCTFSDNSAIGYDRRGGAVSMSWSDPLLTNCTFVDNSGGAAYTRESNLLLTNCTFMGNSGSALYHFVDDDSSPTLTNCLLWGNGVEIYIYVFSGSGSVIARYCDIEGGWPGEGNIDADPCFADADNGDYHLKSQGGRWDANEGGWTTDEVTSPCIDAGDPMSPIGPEPFPNGGTINMGAYGGTAEASKSYFGAAPCGTIVAGDINGDCTVDFLDFRIMALHWLDEQ